MNKIFINVLFIAFFNLLLANSTYAKLLNDNTAKTKNNKEPTILEQEIKETKQAANYPALVNLYQPNYIIHYHTGTPYQAVYLNLTPDNQLIKHDELKSQISFLVPLIRQVFNHKPIALNFAYTQLMYWQVYAKSPYFRETNYEPELFLEHYFNEFFAYQLGVNHESNGQGGILERSWNRAYAQIRFTGTQSLFKLRAWTLIAQAESSDLYNPHIAYYLGYENLLLSTQINQWVASVELQNIESGLKRGYVQLTLSHPISKSISVYGQFFNGYGQSLIEYNHKTSSAGIGISLNDWIN